MLDIFAPLVLPSNYHVNQEHTHWPRRLVVDLVQLVIFVGMQLRYHRSVQLAPIQNKANPHAHSVQLAQCV